MTKMGLLNFKAIEITVNVIIDMISRYITKSRFMEMPKVLFTIDLAILSKITAVLVKFAEGLYYTYHAGEIVIHDIIYEKIFTFIIQASPILLMLILLLLVYLKRAYIKNMILLNRNSDVTHKKAIYNITPKNVLYYNYMKNKLSENQIAKQEKVKLQTARKNIRKVEFLIKNQILKKIK